jgi:hypothetical protein
MELGDDKELLAESLRREPAKEPEPKQETQTEAQPEPQKAEGGDRPRDPATGKFVPKDKAEETQDTKAEAAPDRKPDERKTDARSEGENRIPLAEHLSERERRQAAERRAEELQRRLEAIERQALQQPKQEPPELFSNPDAYVDHRIAPVRQTLEERIDGLRETFSRMLAVQQHGEQAVNEAMNALAEEVQRDPRARFEAQRIWQDEHPVGKLVEWYKSRRTLAEIGSDPAAYRERLLKEERERLANDPEFIRSIIEKTRASAAGANGPAPASIQLPPSLNRATGGGGHQVDAVPRDDRELLRDLLPR